MASVTRAGAALGAYGRQAGGVIDVHWVPDPLVFADKILDVRDELEDRSVPLFLASAAIATDIEQNFEGEHDPEGTPWAPWSSAFHTQLGTGRSVRNVYTDPATDKSYAEKKRYAENLPPGHSGKILNWRGDLKAAATDPASFVQTAAQGINNDSLYFDTGGLPPYWVYHQQPSSPNTGSIPQRRFLGMSGEGELTVLEIFEEWFMGVIEMAVSKKGRIFSRRRDPSRRSAPRQTL
jgi:phage gpG-like protein